MKTLRQILENIGDNEFYRAKRNALSSQKPEIGGIKGYMFANDDPDDKKIHTFVRRKNQKYPLISYGEKLIKKLEHLMIIHLTTIKRKKCLFLEKKYCLRINHQHYQNI